MQHLRPHTESPKLTPEEALRCYKQMAGDLSPTGSFNLASEHNQDVENHHSFGLLQPSAAQVTLPRSPFQAHLDAQQATGHLQPLPMSSPGHQGLPVLSPVYTQSTAMKTGVDNTPKITNNTGFTITANRSDMAVVSPDTGCTMRLPSFSPQGIPPFNTFTTTMFQNHAPAGPDEAAPTVLNFTALPESNALPAVTPSMFQVGGATVVPREQAQHSLLTDFNALQGVEGMGSRGFKQNTGTGDAQQLAQQPAPAVSSNNGNPGGHSARGEVVVQPTRPTTITSPAPTTGAQPQQTQLTQQQPTYLASQIARPPSHTAAAATAGKTPENTPTAGTGGVDIVRPIPTRSQQEGAAAALRTSAAAPQQAVPTAPPASMSMQGSVPFSMYPYIYPGGFPGMMPMYFPLMPGAAAFNAAQPQQMPAAVSASTFGGYTYSGMGQFAGFPPLPSQAGAMPSMVGAAAPAASPDLQARVHSPALQALSAQAAASSPINHDLQATEGVGESSGGTAGRAGSGDHDASRSATAGPSQHDTAAAAPTTGAAAGFNAEEIKTTKPEPAAELAAGTAAAAAAPGQAGAQGSKPAVSTGAGPPAPQQRASTPQHHYHPQFIPPSYPMMPYPSYSYFSKQFQPFAAPTSSGGYGSGQIGALSALQTASGPLKQEMQAPRSTPPHQPRAVGATTSTSTGLTPPPVASSYPFLHPSSPLHPGMHQYLSTPEPSEEEEDAAAALTFMHNQGFVPETKKSRLGQIHSEAGSQPAAKKRSPPGGATAWAQPPALPGSASDVEGAAVTAAAVTTKPPSTFPSRPAHHGPRSRAAAGPSPLGLTSSGPQGTAQPAKRAQQAQQAEHEEAACAMASLPQADLEWLEELTTTERFFKVCQFCGGGVKPGERPTNGGRDALATLLDLDQPQDEGVCANCRQARLAQGHRLLQIRRSTYHDVVKTSDLQSLHVDISGIQVYSINNARVVFLKPRPASKPAKGSTMPSQCIMDGRQLMDSSSKYCSLRCKLDHVIHRVQPALEQPAAAAAAPPPPKPPRKKQRTHAPPSAAVPTAVTGSGSDGDGGGVPIIAPPPPPLTIPAEPGQGGLPNMSTGGEEIAQDSGALRPQEAAELQQDVDIHDAAAGDETGAGTAGGEAELVHDRAQDDRMDVVDTALPTPPPPIRVPATGAVQRELLMGSDVITPNSHAFNAQNGGNAAANKRVAGKGLYRGTHGILETIEEGAAGPGNSTEATNPHLITEDIGDGHIATGSPVRDEDADVSLPPLHSQHDVHAALLPLHDVRDDREVLFPHMPSPSMSPRHVTFMGTSIDHITSGHAGLQATPGGASPGPALSNRTGGSLISHGGGDASDSRSTGSYKRKGKVHRATLE